MQASIETLAMIRQADQSVVDANKAGVAAVMALIQENLQFRFPHGKAAELAAILRDGKVAQHSAKRYADLTAMSVNAIAHQGSLAASKAPNNPTAKGTARDIALADNLTTLIGMASMAKIREWAKENGPKAKTQKPAPTPAAEAAAPTPAAEAAAPMAPNLEALGQMREIRECLAMVNTGQITQTKALETISQIVGLAIAKPIKPTAKPTKTTKPAVAA